ncbi:hypothetical protein BTE48_01850 [Oceanospirillum multiglobuliferum]|uniref:DUF58 domain-containing protein n=2 Tax=Oceanospirillum multiglobuliferum TaxID=64969 RepID=A0A1V4TAC4_9GAMM|nr:hypothetical protein BTE48_01850 [Oceanospirillum multiglobuliferum]
MQQPTVVGSDTVFLPELNLAQLLACQKQSSGIGANLRMPSRSMLAGQHRSTRQGRGMELSEIRNYQAGDDIRLMDWKVTARTQRPHTKVFMEEKERPVQLVVDLSASMLFGSQRSKAEQAAHLAATLGWAIVRQGDRCGGLVFNGTQHQLIRPKARQQGLLPLFQQLCQFAPMLVQPEGRSEAGRMNQMLQLVAAQKGHGNLLVIISDFWSLDLAGKALLRRLASNHQLLAIHISDPLEYQLPNSPCYLVGGQALSQTVFFDGHDKSDRQRYQLLFDQRQQGLEEMLLQVGGYYIQLSTTEHVADKLKRFFTLHNK